MSSYVRFASIIAAVVFSCPNLFAEKAADLQPQLGSLGTIRVEQSFDEPLGKQFVTAKGKWEVTDQVLTGKELAEDQHAAVLSVQQKNHDSAIQASFLFDGTTKGMTISWNHRGGHLFRVAVSPRKLQVTLDKDKKDPASKPVVLGSAATKFEPGQWYTIMVEVRGDQVVVQTDNGAMVKASHSKLDTDKPNYRFVMRGDTLKIDDLKIWQ